MLTRLKQWKAKGLISEEQYVLLAGLVRGEPVSLFLELNVLLYAGVVSFVAGLGWTVATWSHQLGDILVIAALTGMFIACLWYCFSAARPWSATESPSPNLIFDYTLYLGCLTWSVELGYLETRFHLLTGKWDAYLLASAFLFFSLAYRFDNRLVLSLALSSLAGWFRLTVSHWPSHQDAAYRNYAVLFSVIVGLAGIVLQRVGWKAHFLGIYLNVAANVLFWALLSGVFQRQGHTAWLVPLLAAVGAALAWGLARRQFSFVAYAAVYGYVGVSSVITQHIVGLSSVLSYFVITGSLVLAMLVYAARRFGREA